MAMKNTSDNIMQQLEVLLNDAVLQLKKLHRKADSAAPAAIKQEVSVRSLQASDKAARADHRVFEELAIAAYYNANNPNWDPEQPQTYWTKLAEDDPLRQLLKKRDETGDAFPY